jgi:hypothetical protein
MNKDEEYKEQLDLCLAKMIVDLSEREIECFYVCELENLANVSSIRCFQQLLKDKEYGLKAITLLWDHTGATSILYTVFPWQKNTALRGLYEDNSILTIEDWLIENHQEEMMVNFLNQIGKNNEESLEKAIEYYVEQHDLFVSNRSNRSNLNDDERVFYLKHLSQKIEENIKKLREIKNNKNEQNNE